MTPEQIIRNHTPSMTDEDEDLINERVNRWDENVSPADYALRTCMCGKRIDGFYEYANHLIDEMRKAAWA